MQEIRRNLLYEVKKQSSKRSDPFYTPNSQDDDIRAQNQRLRTKLRSHETQIFRLNTKIEELNQKIAISSIKYNTENSMKEDSVKEAVNQFSKVPMILENKELKQNAEILNREIMILNGKNNELQAELRQLKSDKYTLQLRIKQFNILQKMRQQRFKDQVDKLTPIFISQPQDYTTLKTAISHLTKHIRQSTVQVVENLFMLGTKECQGNKKLNSFTIFNNYWKELKARKSYGYAATIGAYRSLRKVMKIVDQGYGEVDLQDSQYKETIDQWIVNSVVQIKTEAIKEEERRLFRLLALKYRSRFPIKGQNWQMSQKVQAYLENAICQEIIRIILPPSIKSPTNNDQQNVNNLSDSMSRK